MNFNEALQAVSQGKEVQRLAVLQSAGFQNAESAVNEVEYWLAEDDFSADGSFSVSEFRATDWVVRPETGLPALSHAALVRAWNAALAEGTPEMQKAPHSARFKRFVEAARG